MNSNYIFHWLYVNIVCLLYSENWKWKSKVLSQKVWFQWSIGDTCWLFQATFIESYFSTVTIFRYSILLESSEVCLSGFLVLVFVWGFFPPNWCIYITYLLIFLCMCFSVVVVKMLLQMYDTFWSVSNRFQRVWLFYETKSAHSEPELS